MIPGLTPSEYEFLLRTVLQTLKARKAQVYLFGSRARQSHQKYSDIDLLVVSQESVSSFLHELEEVLETSNFPYKVDLVEEKDLAMSYRDSVSKDKIRLI